MQKCTYSLVETSPLPINSDLTATVLQSSDTQTGICENTLLGVPFTPNMQLFVIEHEYAYKPRIK